MPRTELSCERLSHEAILSAGGLSDFGGRAYEDGLNHLVTAVNATGESLLPAGYDAARGMIVDALRNRLLLRDNAERHPKIDRIPVSAPVFVLGLPRSGTTLLHNLLALHPQLRAPLYWELRHPVTPPGISVPTLVDDVSASLTALYRTAPALRSIHAQDTQSPDECTWLLANEFAAMVFTFAFDVPDYLNWLLTTNLTDAFAAHRRQLQHILWRRPGGTLVLKDPYHALYLDELNTVYPDARFIYLHRDPVDVLSSLCSLRETVRRMHYRDDRPEIHGPQLLALITHLLNRQHTFRQDHPMPTRNLDVSYHNLVADPVGETTTIFEFLGLGCSAAQQTALRAHLSRSPQHRFGVHRHSLARYSLDDTQVRRKLASFLSPTRRPPA